MSTTDPFAYALVEFGGREVTDELAPYVDDPAGFARDCIIWPRNGGLSDYQAEVLTELAQRGRAAVRGPHGLGKTTIAALAVLWFAITRDGKDWKIPTTASVWRQLLEYLWPEIHKWARLLRWDVIGRAPFDERRELQTLTLRLATGSAFALASDTPSAIEGAHAEHLLYVFDEAKAIPAATFDAAEGAFSGGGAEALALAISTPGEPNGRFYDIHARRSGLEDWWVRHVTRDEAMAAGRMASRWEAQRRSQWGETSAVYQNRVLGNFASSEEDAVVPLAWIEAANERWRVWDEAGRLGSLTALGVDVARSGEDRTVLAPRATHEGLDAITELRISHLEDTTQTTSRVQGLLSAKRVERVVVDVIGIGAGVFDQLRALKADAAPELRGVMVDAFNASARSDRRDRSGEFGFVNSRAAAWWGMRELLDPAFGSAVALPPDDELTGDLTAPRWWVASGARIQIESKDEVRKRIGRSTDAGDAVIQAFWHQAGDMFAADAWVRVKTLPHDALIESGAVWVRRWHTIDVADGQVLAGVLLARSRANRYFVVDARRATGNPAALQRFLRATYDDDVKRWRCRAVRIAAASGTAGRLAHGELLRLLPNADVGGRAETGDDEVRAGPWAGAVGQRLVSVLGASWMLDYLDEHTTYPNAPSAWVDASALAYLDLAQGSTTAQRSPLATSRTRHRR